MGANRYLKTTIIGRALIIAVLGFYVSLFIWRQWLISPVWLVAVFCILPYAIIYFHREWKYGIRVLGAISIGLYVYLDGDIYLILGFIAALIGFYQTSHTIHEDVHNKIKVSGFDVFTGESVEKFVTYMTVVYVFTFVSFYQTFNLTCEGLYYYTNKIVDTALLRNNPDTMNQFKDYIEQFFVTNVDEVISNNRIAQVIDINQSGALALTNKSAATSIKLSQSMLTTTGVSSVALLKAIEEYRQRILAQTVDNSNSIDEGVCSMIVGEIKEKYDKPEFKINVIFLMYILIRPSIEVALHLISYLNWAIFHLMYKLGWFKKYEDWEVAENLE